GKALLTATPSLSYLVYRHALPTRLFPYTTLFRSGDTALSVTITGSPSGCSTLYTATSPVGNYDISCTSTGNLATANYSFVMGTGDGKSTRRQSSQEAVTNAATYGTEQAPYSIQLT